MRTLELQGSKWRTRDDFFDAFFAAVGAPSWHGRNLNALHDSIGGGDINTIELPYAIRIDGLAEMGQAARTMVEHFSNLLDHLKAAGDQVSLELIE